MSKFSNIIRPANAIPRWPFIINRQSEQARGLLGWWPGAEGNVLLDATENGFNGTLQAATFASDATGCRVATSNTYALLATNLDVTALTISVWVTFASGALGSLYRTFLAKRDLGTNATNYAFRLGGLSAPSDNKLCLYWNSGGFSLWESTAAISGVENQLVHYAATYDGAANPTLFIDGVSIAGGFTLGSATTLLTNNAQASIGALNDGTEQMSGLLRDVRLYNRALSAYEVWALYDPATRYELYQPLSRRVYGFAPSVAVTYKDASARVQALSGVKTSSSILRSASARLTTQSTVRTAISRAVAAHAEILARSTVAAKANRLAGASAKLTTRSTVQATPSLLRGASVRVQSRASMQTRASAWRAIAAQLQGRSGILCGTIEQLSIAPGRLFDVPYEQRIFRVRYEDRTFRVPRA